MRPEHALATVARELQVTLRDVDPHELEALAAALRTSLIPAGIPAPRTAAWFCTGQGRSGLVAAMASMRLMHLGVRAHLVGEATTPSISQGDVLLALSASGRTAVTLHMARLAAEHGAQVVALTRVATSPLVDVADVVVVLPGPPSVQFGGSLFEQSCLAVLDAVALSLAPHPQQQETMQSRHANLQ